MGMGRETLKEGTTMKTTKTYGVKFLDGSVIRVNAHGDLQAKVAACVKGDRDIYAVAEVWVIGQYWDENGNAR